MSRSPALLALALVTACAVEADPAEPPESDPIPATPQPAAAEPLEQCRADCTELAERACVSPTEYATCFEMCEYNRDSSQDFLQACTATYDGCSGSCYKQFVTDRCLDACEDICLDGALLDTCYQLCRVALPGDKERFVRCADQRISVCDLTCYEELAP